MNINISPDVAKKLLLIREALIQDNNEEAYHQLCLIADPLLKNLDHWKELEDSAKGNKTKTLQEIKNELAKDLGYKDWASVVWYEIDESNCITSKPYAEERALQQVCDTFEAQFTPAVATDNTGASPNTDVYVVTTDGDKKTVTKNGVLMTPDPNFDPLKIRWYIHAPLAAHSRIPIQSVNDRESRAYVAGCEMVWNDYVLPARQQSNSLLKRIEELESENTRRCNKINRIVAELHEANERIKELE